MRESKCELTDRLRREGKWEEFKKRREQLKAEGVPAKEAWRQAESELPPFENRTFVIVPTVKWKDAKVDLDQAFDGFDWLQQAVFVKLPKNACEPDLRALVERIRTNARLQDEFFKIMFEREIGRSIL